LTHPVAASPTTLSAAGRKEGSGRIFKNELRTLTAIYSKAVLIYLKAAFFVGDFTHWIFIDLFPG